MSHNSLFKRIPQHPIFLEGEDEFSEVTEEKTSEVKQAESEDKEVQLGWRTFHEEKIAIDKLKKELLKNYVYYRRNLTEAIREFCHETNNRTYNYAALMESQDKLQASNQATQELKDAKSEEVEEKIAMVQKILSQRKIKRYYKTKYEVNFKDELDPDDDHEHIYQYYEQIFGGGKPQLQQKHLSQPTSQIVHQPQIILPQLPPVHSTQYNIRDTRSDPVATERVLSNKIASTEKVNYQVIPPSRKLLQPNTHDIFLNGHELSFDVRREQNIRVNELESFALHQENYGVNQDEHSMGKLVQSEEHLSQRENKYSDFISKQNEQLMQQRLKVQELTEKAMKVLNNDDIEDEDFRDQELHQESDKFSQLKYLLGQIIEVFSVAQCLKYQLKYKSFELINRLYEHASHYYEEHIAFEEPISVKYFSQIIAAAIPEQDEEAIRVVVEKIFDKESELSFDEFVQMLTPRINDHEFKLIEESLITPSGNTIFDLAVRLFDLWIEFDYFEKNIKDILHSQPLLTQKFLGLVSEDAALVPSLVIDFMLRGKKSKARKLKVEIFFRKILGDRLKNSEFYRWIETRKVPINSSFENIKEKEKFEYFYNLY